MRHIDRIVIHHSASAANAHTWSDIRRWHLAKGWSDIGYHFGVVHDGDAWSVVRGRPVEQIGAHAKGFNERSIGICVEGNYDLAPPPREAFEQLVELVWTLGQAHGLVRVPAAIAVNGESGVPSWIKGHRELPYPTACPGRYFPLGELRGVVADRSWLQRAHAA